MGAAFVEDLPIGRFHGIGPATTAKMNGLGIFTGRDLRAQTLSFLQGNFGKAGSYYHAIARGVDERPVRADRIRKSVGAENTFSEDLTGYDALCEALQPIIKKVWRHCETSDIRGRTVTLKVKFADFDTITRSRTHVMPVAGQQELVQSSLELLSGLMPVTKGIRLLGVTISSLTNQDLDADPQMELAF
jgi:DNA polymerase-4